MIYFAQGPDPTGDIKFGCSNNPELRMRQISAAGRPVSLILAIPGGKREESYLAWRFRDYQTIGEWYRCCGDVLWYIARCREEMRLADFNPQAMPIPDHRKEVSGVFDWGEVMDWQTKRQAGWTYQRIADERGISRQAVQQRLRMHFSNPTNPTS